MKSRCASNHGAPKCASSEKLLSSDIERLDEALQSSSYSYVSGSTHAFYHYPARFSPAIARAVIHTFSEPGDWVLDPFMGGGTAIIEGLQAGRKMLGVDINTLAHFVTRVRTTPLSHRDEREVLTWAAESAGKFASGEVRDFDWPSVENLPGSVKVFIAGALGESEQLQNHRQRLFARCVLLRLGQWALDCRDFAAPRRRRLGDKLPALTNEMLRGLREFVGLCRRAGARRTRIIGNRRLLCRDAVDLHQDPRVAALLGRPRLVFTSPPYPGVHVLYHRWQYRGRRETAAPYWIASVQDGHFESFYLGGSRTPTGQKRYFRMITSAFASVRALMSPRGIVVQLVGFADAETQLPQYLHAMQEAGFDEWGPFGASVPRLKRRVPNRKWYARLQGAGDASSELLLFHRPG